MKIMVLLILTSVVGCSTSYVVGPKSLQLTYNEFTEEMKEKNVTIIHSGRMISEGTNIHVDSAYAEWMDEKSYSPVEISTKTLRRVTVKDRWRGAIEGLGIGVGATLGLTLALGKIMVSSGPGGGEVAMGIAVIAAVGMAASLIGGPIVGAVVGHSNHYEFSEYKFSIPPIAMEFVLVQPGTFQMGSNEGESNEKPIHSVTISKPYFIGKYEVTQKQWRDVMGTNPSKYQGDDRPVENVSWDDIQEFIRTLNEKEETTKYRLPTEAEWEFASRGGTQSKGYKFAGSNLVAEVAVHSENAGSETKPVGSKQPNELGIFDMSGNVWEWCEDWYGPYIGGAQIDPKGAANGSYRVLRGGSSFDLDGGCRVAFRLNYYYPDYRNHYYYFGFRCVRDAE